MLTPNQQTQYQRLTGNGLIKKGSGGLSGFLVAQGTPTVTIYDNTTNSGTLILNGIACTAGNSYPCPALFTQGCYAAVSGGDVTFFYN